jgi:hypothetical protein
MTPCYFCRYHDISSPNSCLWAIRHNILTMPFGCRKFKRREKI